MKRTIGLDDTVYGYLLDHSLREPPVMAALRAETDALAMSRMRSSAEQVQFLGLLLKAIGAKRLLEVGVFTGYATLGFALALPEGGEVVALDVSEEWTSMGRRYWSKAAVASRIDLRLAPALDSLDRLIADGQADSFDFAFIDADKVNYGAYVERCLTLVRRGGLIAVDNVLWSGRVADPDEDDPDTVAIRALNDALVHDDRIDLSMLPIGDGLTLARRR